MYRDALEGRNLFSAVAFDIAYQSRVGQEAKYTVGDLHLNEHQLYRDSSNDLYITIYIMSSN